jgi:hypothetical protein
LRAGVFPARTTAIVPSHGAHSAQTYVMHDITSLYHYILPPFYLDSHGTGGYHESNGKKPCRETPETDLDMLSLNSEFVFQKRNNMEEFSWTRSCA